MDHPVSLCENCGKLSHQRCSRCKAFFVCSRECLNAAWPRHKPDCNKVVAATKYFEAIGAPEGSGVPCMISTEDMLRLDARSIAVYRKYGVDELPDSDSTMEVNTKYALFLDVLRENDTCTASNRGRPLPEKLLLNKYYNAGQGDFLAEPIRAARGPD
ncbi:hypothetical protein PF005_g16146 [Phytophthora fragariae]|uniref:MYND-type domain-containing protein n=1 Tax=Phytophthora fragariae TaxID=53985 RepID=A0A6A3ESV2_9STRA|nr:hypothetical protein PF003_g10115 [Phytophthora fragariae]KAE8933078.1 hypothetical protein PF009_g16908 [Phytophthora fragariae]KAE8997896.1 hypothetical protein PF011_g15276 [Phytophthora fragariae]KAE9096347.1 hypothetical protein PF010_g16375 [Phytophthora fragariae]KAE9097874.1 hypothetical protein PF007_g16462 [Phytophthora fragariae]